MHDRGFHGMGNFFYINVAHILFRTKQCLHSFYTADEHIFLICFVALQLWYILNFYFIPYVKCIVTLRNNTIFYSSLNLIIYPALNYNEIQCLPIQLQNSCSVNMYRFIDIFLSLFILNVQCSMLSCKRQELLCVCLLFSVYFLLISSNVFNLCILNKVKVVVKRFAGSRKIARLGALYRGLSREITSIKTVK